MNRLRLNIRSIDRMDIQNLLPMIVISKPIKHIFNLRRMNFKGGVKGKVFVTQRVADMLGDCRDFQE